MPDRFVARLFWLIGLALAVLGVVVWLTVPVRPMFPPYLASALFAAGYGELCRRRAARAARSQP